MSTCIAEEVNRRYRGAEGARYHAAVHGCSQQASEVVARQRRHKIQPFVSASDVVLEFGAGTGYNLRYLQCQRRIAYDLSDAGRSVCESAGIEFTTDLDCLPEKFADVVLCHHVLEHVPDPLDTLTTMGRYLKPGGRLLLFVPSESQRRYRRYAPGNKNMHLFSWNALTLGNLVSAAGLSPFRIETRPFGYEQRLAGLVQYGWFAYRAGLWLVRRIRPEYEIMLLANRG